MGKLTKFAELIAADTVSGDGDLLCQFVARDNTHFQSVLQAVMATEGVVRSRSEIVRSVRYYSREGCQAAVLRITGELADIAMSDAKAWSARV